jgi:hypothetical protein
VGEAPETVPSLPTKPHTLFFGYYQFMRLRLTGDICANCRDEISPDEISPRLDVRCDRQGFPNREAIVQKALEEFLSFENPNIVPY